MSVKRLIPALEVLLVVVAMFVKVFPLSGIVFGLIVAGVLSATRHPGFARQWFGKPISLGWCMGWVLVVVVLDLSISSGLIAAFSRTAQGAPDLSRFDDLKGNLPLLLLWLGAIWSIVAFGEEIISRGFVFECLREAFGQTRYTNAMALVVSAIIFGSVHYYQGVSGVVMNTTIGLLYGGLYLIQRRNLWANVLVHAIVDSVAMIAYYLGVMQHAH
jgi:membrane protease YdiL (CAAX protease family)